MIIQNLAIIGRLFWALWIVSSTLVLMLFRRIR